MREQVSADRPLTLGSRPAARAALLAVVAVALGAVHLRHRPVTMCPLRALTGLPCPFCGGTTAVADLGRGKPLAALLASPLSLGLVLSWPFAATGDRPGWVVRWWSNRPLRIGVIVAVLVVAEVWQLVRFGVIAV